MGKELNILFISIIVAMLGYGVAMPVLPFYIGSFGGGGIHLGLLIASYAIMQFLFAPVWGSLSDKKGRKPLLLLGMIGMGISMLLIGFSRNLMMLYTAQIIAGSLSSAVFPVSMAYVSDITDGEKRSSGAGKVGAAAGLGVVLGPGIGGLLAGGSLSKPFFVSAAFSFITFMIILMFLPESLDKGKRTKAQIRIKIIQLKELFKALYSPIAFGLIIAFSIYFGKSNFSSIYGLYALEKFDYGPQQVGSILMIMSLIYVLAQGVLVGPLTRKFGEKKVIKVALLGNSIGFVFIALANSYLTMALSISFFILLNALIKPSAIAFISKNSKNSQGQTMGITESFMSLGRITGPLWAGGLFDINIYYPFISGGMIFLIMFLISLKK